VHCAVIGYSQWHGGSIHQRHKRLAVQRYDAKYLTGTKGQEELLTQSGMAMRLAVDLGLHIKVVRPINGTSITPEEERLRSKIFWGAYIHER
jgi:hypothetical protein